MLSKKQWDAGINCFKFIRLAKFAFGSYAYEAIRPPNMAKTLTQTVIASVYASACCICRGLTSFTISPIQNPRSPIFFPQPHGLMSKNVSTACWHITHLNMSCAHQRHPRLITRLGIWISNAGTRPSKCAMKYVAHECHKQQRHPA